MLWAKPLTSFAFILFSTINIIYIIYYIIYIYIYNEYNIYIANFSIAIFKPYLYTHIYI